MSEDNTKRVGRTDDEVSNATTIVKEYTTPLHKPIDPDINLFDFLAQRAQRDPDGSMVCYKDADGAWQTF